MEIPLANTDIVAVVDEEDAGRVSEHSWCLLKHKGKNVRYARCGTGGRTVLLHRFILGLSDSKIHVDHINHNGLDCRKANLRLASYKENAANRRKHMKNPHSRFKGVSYTGGRHRKRWFCAIMKDGKSTYLGRFATELEGALAYDKAARALFGEFAYTNFSKETV